MLKDIRFKIALQNIPILVSFVLVFCIIVIAFLSGIMTAASIKYSNEMINKAFYVADDKLFINEEIIKDTALLTSNMFSRFEGSYIVYDYEMNIYKIHNVSEKMKEMINIFAYDVLLDDGSKINNIKHDKEQFRVMTQVVKGENRSFIVQIVHNISQEKKILELFTQAMIITGGFGIITVIIIGWYFAGKRLGPIENMYLKQRRFIADASHEIKTPLTIIQTNIDVLRAKEQMTVKDNLKWIDNIDTEVFAMRRLIDDMLLLANAQDIGLEIDIEQIHLSKLIKDACMRQSLVSIKNGIELHYEQKCDIVAMADKNRIEQLIKIFVDNAIKYNKKGGNVWVRLDLENDNVIIEIEDDGVGMNQEETAHIFERFYRSDKSRKCDRNRSGFGLGLSIAKEIIEAHDGIIQVESEKDKGTHFKIIFYNMAVK